MATLAIAGIFVSAAAALSVWRASERLWHPAAIVLIAILLFPLAAASPLTGDVSRHLPAATFAEGIEGKDQIIVASVAASFLLALIVASGIWAAGKLAWRTLRRRSG